MGQRLKRWKPHCDKKHHIDAVCLIKRLPYFLPYFLLFVKCCPGICPGTHSLTLPQSFPSPSREKPWEQGWLSLSPILRDPGAVTWGGEKSKRATKKFGRRKVKKSPNKREKNSGEEKSRTTFLLPNFFSHPFGLFPAPTNCPCFSEDASHPQLDKKPRPTNRMEKPIITILLVLEKLQAFSCKWKIDNRQLLYNHLLIYSRVDIKFSSLERCQVA